MNVSVNQEPAGQAGGNRNADAPMETSLLFERHAVWFHLAGLALSVWFRYLPTIAVFTFLLLLTLWIRLWKRNALAAVEPRLELSKTRMFVGETFSAHASVRNGKWLPLVWLEWEFPVHPSVRWGEDRREKALVRFLWLLWHRRVRWTLQGEAARRGVYEAGNVTLRSGDAFRLTETEKTYRLGDRIFVYPKLLPVRVPSHRYSVQWGVNGKRGGFLEDPLLIGGVREYVAGDERRRINWRASSRTGKLQVNVCQPIVTARLMLYLDVRGFVIDETKYEGVPDRQLAYRQQMSDNFERFLSFAASAAVAYHEQKIRVGLATNALNVWEKRLGIAPPSDSPTPVLDAMAQMAPKVGAPGTSVLDALLHEGKLSMPLFLFCESIPHALVEWVRRHQHQAAEIRLFYMTRNEGADRLGALARPIESLLSAGAAEAQVSPQL